MMEGGSKPGGPSNRKQSNKKERVKAKPANPNGNAGGCKTLRKKDQKLTPITALQQDLEKPDEEGEGGVLHSFRRRKEEGII